MGPSYGTDPQDFQSETTSIASAIHKGRMENGRSPILPDINHLSHMVFLVLDHNQPNSLFRAPIGNSPKNIMDIGTGQGTTVRGVDIFPPPVSWMPPNYIFKVDDMLREWTWRDPDDGTLKKEHLLSKWGPMFVRLAERAGRSLRTYETMRNAIKKAGFADVYEEKYKIPLGPWPKDPLLKEAGYLQFAH
ncbi:hypothetical protein N7505_007483 [Penicillium chrysogenum]|uniref:S-adenosyl-L-methionine-dependent methyltransferase n=1 Tax=Penicillium chrysogenum TaxID=5076 RepID=A0ABQ8WDR3_PENCH|nr:hypothetical protein N7505_007483 [Penicillium chrysogenum]